MGRYIRDKVNHVDIPVYGSGGHTIKNQSGTEFTQRKNLKFNNATVVDDAINNATIITPTGDPTNFYGTLQEWEALTQAQKDAYDSVDLIDDYTDITDTLDSLTDSVGDLDEAVSTIGDTVDDLTTYSEVSYTPAYQYASGHQFTFRKMGKLVIMSGCVLSNSCPVSQSVTLFTITDSEFLPKNSVQVNFTDNNNGIHATININTAGVVTIWIYNSSKTVFRANGNQAIYFTN